MLPFLSLHVIASQRGDGLHPVLLAGLKRLAAEHGDCAAREARREPEEQAAEPIADCSMRGVAKPPRDRAADWLD
jgi:hypothetical protein